MHTSIHSEFTGSARHSRTQWFYGCFALSPEIGLSCLRHLADLSAKLDASVEASGPHDLAVRFSAVRRRHIHVHRIPPRVRDDREPPLKWDGTSVDKHVIWVGREEEYFRERGWTGQITLIRLDKLLRARKARQPRLRAAAKTAMEIIAWATRIRRIRSER
jgi:hypothetical protein